MTTTTKYFVKSASWIYTPNTLKHARELYRDDAEKGIELMDGLAGGLPLRTALEFLKGEIEFEIDGEDAVFTVIGSDVFRADEAVLA